MQQVIQPRKKALGYLGTFFSVMLIVTLLSTTLANLSTAKVTIAMPERKSLTYRLEAQGILSSGSEIPVFVNELFIQSGIYVDSILVHAGDKVSVGAPLLKLNREQLEQALKDAKEALERLQLLDRQAGIQSDAKPNAALAQEESQKNSETASRNRERSLRQAQDAVDLAEHTLVDARSGLEEAGRELEQAKSTALKAAEEAYAAAVKSAEDAAKQAEDTVKAAQDSQYQTLLQHSRAVQDCQDAVNAAQAVVYNTPDVPSQKALADAKKALSRAQDDYNYAAQRTSAEVAKTQQAAAEAHKKVEDIHQQNYASYYNADSVHAADAAVTQAQADVHNDETALEKAKDDQAAAVANAADEVWKEEFDQKKQQDANRIQNAQESADRQRREIDRNLREMELETASVKVSSLQQMIADGGILKAACSGAVKSVEAQEGSPVTAVAARITQDADSLALVCTVPTEAVQFFKPGDPVTLRFPGQQKEALEAPIQNIRQVPGKEEGMEITVLLEKGTAETGMSVQLAAEKESRRYPCVIPLSVIRSDDEGYFVLAVRRKEDGWGEKSYAERIGIAILEKTTEAAAVDGGLSISDQCIDTASKNIEAGDSVRIAG